MEYDPLSLNWTNFPAKWGGGDLKKHYVFFWKSYFVVCKKASLWVLRKVDKLGSCWRGGFICETPRLSFAIRKLRIPIITVDFRANLLGGSGSNIMPGGDISTDNIMH